MDQTQAATYALLAADAYANIRPPANGAPSLPAGPADLPPAGRRDSAC